jgi:hypothetical protein
MAGLYDGLEDVAFKRTEGGYVFQTNNRFLIGPRRRFLVNEAQKADIAACMRETLRRIKPFVFLMMAALPAAIVGLIYWFVATSATLTVIVVDSGGKTEIHEQAIGRHGATGTLAGADGSSAAYRVSGPPGAGATVTTTAITASGKVGATSVVPFDAAGTIINMADAKKRIVRSAKLIGRTGPTRTAAALFAAGVSLGLIGLYIAAIHIYSMARLNPLLAGLPRTNERIGMREGFDRFAAKVSIKLLAVMGFGVDRQRDQHGEFLRHASAARPAPVPARDGRCFADRGRADRLSRGAAGAAAPAQRLMVPPRPSSSACASGLG